MRVPKCHQQIDLSKWHCLISMYDAMKRCPRRPEASPVDSHGIESVSVEDVEATPTIHKHLGETLVADDGVHDQGTLPRSRHIAWIISSNEGDR